MLASTAAGQAELQGRFIHAAKAEMLSAALLSRLLKTIGSIGLWSDPELARFLLRIILQPDRDDALAKAALSALGKH